MNERGTLAERLEARRIQRRKKRIRLMVDVLLLTAAAIILSITWNSKAERKYTVDTVIVHKGTETGTLWDIACAYAPEDMDRRKYVEFLKQDNNCTELIYPGDVLKIRRYE